MRFTWAGVLKWHLRQTWSAFCRRQFRRVDDVRWRRAFRVLRARTVAGLAGHPFPPSLVIALDRVMGIVLEGLEDVVVTGLAGIRAHVTGGLVLR